jgi:hypothetical protein
MLLQAGLSADVKVDTESSSREQTRSASAGAAH